MSNMLDSCVPDSYLLSLLNVSEEKGKETAAPKSDASKRSRRKQQHTCDVPVISIILPFLWLLQRANTEPP